MALGERLVSFTPLKVAEAKFPTLDRDTTREVVTQITAGIPDYERVIALDRVLAYVDTSQIIPKNVEGVKADPPTIFFSTGPAVLVNFDGDPIWSPIKDNDLKFAVNTNWDLFEHAPTKTLLPAPRPVVAEGHGREGAVDAGRPAAGQLLEAAGRRQLEGREGRAARQEARRQGRADGLRQHDAGRDAPPARATELPAGERHDDLLWVQNTESDVFRLGRTGPVYYLVAGRWFSAPDFTGPWTFATPKLPADFKKIPLEHPRSRVLASVPGTPQAAEAVLLAQVPQTARVNKKELKAPEVAYQGDPEVRADREDDARAGRQHRQGHHQGRRPLLHVLPGRVVRVASPQGRGRSRARCRRRSTRSRPARPSTTSPTSPWSRKTPATTG